MPSAKAVFIDLSGTAYDVTTTSFLTWTNPFTDSASLAATALAQSQPWYGSAVLAEEAAGDYFTAGGPFANFIFNVDTVGLRWDGYGAQSTPGSLVITGITGALTITNIAIVRGVPDSGLTAVLMLVSLVGIAGFRRKFERS